MGVAKPCSRMTGTPARRAIPRERRGDRVWVTFLRDWHCYTAGVAYAPAYQLVISAFSYNPGDSTPNGSTP